MLYAELIVLKDVFDIELYLYCLLTAGIVLKECLYILNRWTLQLSDTKQVSIMSLQQPNKSKN